MYFYNEVKLLLNISSLAVISINLRQNVINPDKLLIDLRKHLLSSFAQLDLANPIWLELVNEVEEDLITCHPLYLDVLHCHVHFPNCSSDALDLVGGDAGDDVPYLGDDGVVLVDFNVFYKSFKAKYYFVVHLVMLVHHILDPSMHLDRDILNLHGVHDSSNLSSDTPNVLLLVLSQLLVFSLILLFNAHFESEQLVLDVDDHLLVLVTGLRLLPGALGLAGLLGRDVHELVLDLVVVQGLRVIQVRHKLVLVV